MFREGETERFPFDCADRKVWFGIVILDYDVKPLSFTSANSGKRNLLNKIDELNCRGDEFMILGVWQGNWRTDIFILDKVVTVKKLNGVI